MQDDVEIIRHYTSVRRIPMLFGRFRDGTRLWGGPYTVLQAVTFCLVIAGSMLTRPVWGFGNMLGDLMTVATVTVLAVWAVGKVPTSSKNPVWLVVGAWTAATAPAAGTVAGRPFVASRPARPRADPRAIAEARELLGATSDTRRQPAVAATAQPAPPEQPAPGRPAVTGVEHLRAVAAARKE